MPTAYAARSPVIPFPKPPKSNIRLLDHVRDIIRKKHYSIRTEEAYLQ